MKRFGHSFIALLICLSLLFTVGCETVNAPQETESQTSEQETQGEVETNELGLEVDEEAAERFYRDSDPADSHFEALNRAENGELAGADTVPYQAPSISEYRPMIDGKYVKNSDSYYVDNNTYVVVNAYGDEVFRVYRGGGWDKFPSSCRSAHRDHGSPSHKDDDLGFRLCCGFCVDAVPDKTSWQAQEICDQVLREEDTLEYVQKPSVKVVIKVTSVQKSKDDNPRDNIVTIPTSGQSDELVTAQSLYDEAENYYRGQHGVKEDRVKAFKLYQIAAQLGNPDAQYSLGYMYANGDSVARDYAKGLFWYRKAAMQGHEKAGRLANGLAERMKDGM